jgi:hypothetical protein
MHLMSKGFVNAIDDVRVMYNSYSGFRSHHDLYNLGVLLGKAGKIFMALYMDGILEIFKIEF